MKTFLDQNFLLHNKTAQNLYHQHASKMPIIDYHCHLIPAMVANDHKFRSLTEIWLGGDHYKWRALRTNGVDEKYITSNETTDWEKFKKSTGSSVVQTTSTLYLRIKFRDQYKPELHFQVKNAGSASFTTL